jgi:hypothetical protein
VSCYLCVILFVCNAPSNITSVTTITFACHICMPKPHMPSPTLLPPPHTHSHKHTHTHTHTNPQDYEIDFISLSYTRSVDDVLEARAFLDAVGLGNTKVRL